MSKLIWFNFYASKPLDFLLSEKKCRYCPRTRENKSIYKITLRLKSIYVPSGIIIVKANIIRRKVEL